MRRVAAICALLMTAAYAGNLQQARDALQKPDADARRAAIAVLVQLDSRAALDVLVNALRRANREHPAKAKAVEKQGAKFTKKIRQLTAELKKIQEGKGSFDAKMKRMNETMVKASAVTEKLVAVRTAYLPHDALMVDGHLAIQRFQSDEAVARLMELAEKEPAGRLRQSALVALVDRKNPAIAPTMMALTLDKDPRVRAIAVRALRAHVAVPGVADSIAACAEDDCWQVRRGAYRGLAAIKKSAALKAALSKETGDQRRILAGYLHALGSGGAAPAAPRPAFGLPLTSMRVRFVLDFSKALKARILPVKRELAKAIVALPDGAQFEVVAVDIESHAFAAKPTRMTPSARKRVLKWIQNFVPDDESGASRVREALTPAYDDPRAGKRAFPSLPDAVYLICAGMQADDVRKTVAQFTWWNSACDATLHVCVWSGTVPDALRRLSEGTGGVCATR